MIVDNLATVRSLDNPVDAKVGEGRPYERRHHRGRARPERCSPTSLGSSRRSTRGRSSCAAGTTSSGESAPACSSGAPSSSLREPAWATAWTPRATSTTASASRGAADELSDDRHGGTRRQADHGVRPDRDAAATCTTPSTPGHHDRVRGRRRRAARHRPRPVRRSPSSPTASTSAIDCDFIVGCDGFHGVSRTAIPAARRREFEKDYPFGWLGILSETPPLPMLDLRPPRAGVRPRARRRTPMLSRYYVQAPLDRRVDDWPDDRFWTELLARRPPTVAAQVVDRAVDREVARAAAQLRLRADAPRQPVPRRRRRPHRAADRRQGPQPRRVRRLLPGPRARRALRRRRPPPRRLLGHGVAPGVGSGAVLVVADHDAPPVPRPERLRPPRERARARPPGVVDVAQAAFAEQYVGLPYDQA